MTDNSYPSIYPTTRKVLNATPNAVVVTDTNLRIVSLNQHAEKITQSTEGELIGSHAAEMFPERSREQFHELIAHALMHPTRHAERSPAELSINADDSTNVIADIGVRPLELDGHDLIVISLRDVTDQKRVEHELRTSRMLLDEAQRLAQLGSWRWDIKNDVVTWSSELFRIFGVEESDKPLDYNQFISHIHPADRDRVKSIITDALENQSSFGMEHRIVRPDGTVRLVYGQGVVEVTDAGGMVSLFGTSQDITERKANEAQAFQLALEQAARQEAERTKERFQFLAEVSETLSTSLEYEATLERLMGLIIPRRADWCTINTLGDQGDLVRVAAAHRDPAKQPLLEMLQERDFLPHGDEPHPLTQALHEAKPGLHSTITDKMLQRLARSKEHLELSRQLNPVSAMLVPLVARGRTFGIVMFGMSDSGRRYTQEDLQLAIEVTHRAAVSIDNAHLYQDAQEAARAREEFVSLVSHELKTPLTVIKGYIQVMERYLNKSEWERERIRKSRERLSTQVDRLELLVADILDASRIQRGRLDLNVAPDTDIVALVRQVIERFDDAIERQPDHKLRLDADGPIIGCWDPLRLDQVFSNLLSNALKYSPEGGPINVIMRTYEHHVHIAVQDHGVGIPADEQLSLFQPFQRGAISARGISGTGLGLYITRQIVEQHGGEISVASAPGETTTFHIQLPRQPEIDAPTPR